MKKLIFITISALLLLSCQKIDILTIEKADLKQEGKNVKLTLDVTNTGQPRMLEITLFQTELTTNQNYKQEYLITNKSQIVFNYANLNGSYYYIALNWIDSNGKNYKVYAYDRGTTKGK